jgi:hypothetical protein
MNAADPKVVDTGGRLQTAKQWLDGARKTMARTTWRCGKCGAHGEIAHLDMLSRDSVVELVNLEHWKSGMRCKWDDEEIFIRRVR